MCRSMQQVRTINILYLFALALVGIAEIPAIIRTLPKGRKLFLMKFASSYSGT